MNIRHLAIAGVAITTLQMSGCASAPVIYGDATAVENTTLGFGSTDLQMIAAKMVDDMLVFPPLVEITSSRRPVLFVESIKNKTTEHIDMESITDTITNKLINSGRFRFVDMTAVQQLRNQLDYQRNSGMVDQSKAVQAGRQSAAEYMLTGNMSSIEKYNGRVKDVYYKFTLKLIHLQSNEILWTNEKEIRKSASKPAFGF